MKITLSDLYDLVQSFSALAGRPVEVSDGDKKVVIVKPYDIDGTARYAIARMRGAAKVHLVAIEDEREALVAKSGLDAVALNKDPVKFAAFKAAMDAFLKKEVDFTEHRIPVATIKIGTNQLDPGVIANLLPILDGEV